MPPVSRMRAAEFLALRLPGAIVMGDFNETPGGPVHSALSAAGWQDSGEDSPTATYHGYGLAREPGRIDWVLAPRAFEVRSHRVDVRGGPAWPSDHHPVLVDLSRTG